MIPLCHVMYHIQRFQELGLGHLQEVIIWFTTIRQNYPLVNSLFRPIKANLNSQENKKIIWMFPQNKVSIKEV